MTTRFKNCNVGVWILVELAPELDPGCPMLPNWNSWMLLGITILINKKNDANGKQLFSELQAGLLQGLCPLPIPQRLLSTYPNLSPCLLPAFAWISSLSSM